MEQPAVTYHPDATVWKVQVIETSRKTLVYGTMLTGLPKLIDRDERTFSNFSKMLRSYFSRPMAGAPIRIEVNGACHETFTDARGNFRIEVDAYPVSPIRISDSRSEHPFRVLQDYPVQFQLTDAPYLVVSDIDDTILVSHTQSILSRLRVLLFDAPADRRAVEATQQAFNLLNTPLVQFMYLSRSEINLFHLIGGFLQHHDIPLGPIFLRDYTRWRGLLGEKDPQYKFRRMAWIAEAFPDKKLLLFGDDSQQDLDVFTHIARQQPERVHSIFIRQTSEAARKPVEARLERSSIPTLHYRTFEDIAPFLQNQLHELTVGD